MSAFSWRCQYCGWAFQMPSEAVATALVTAEAAQARHHVEHCPRCRKALKIPLDQLRRHVPSGALAPTPVPGFEPIAKEETKAMSDKPAFPPFGGPPKLPTPPPMPVPPPTPPVAPLGTSIYTPPPVTPAIGGPAQPRPQPKKPAVKKPAAKRHAPKKKAAKKVAARKPAAKKKVVKKKVVRKKASRR